VLLPIRIGKRNATPELEIFAWLDTAINGTLVLPKKVAFELGLPVESTAETILANSELVELETYGCSIHWLGKVYDTQIVTNESEYGPIGTGLLVDRIITVDYKSKTVSVD
jgi:predicted aspartyl protease